MASCLLGIVDTTSPIWSRSAETNKETNQSDIELVTRKGNEEGIRTKNGGFPGIVKAENQDPSFLVPKQRRKQPREYYSHFLANLRKSLANFPLKMQNTRIRSKKSPYPQILPAKPKSRRIWADTIEAETNRSK